MKKIYVVTAGDYSDYHIEGVFTNKDRAEEYRAAIGADNVEEHDLDPEDDICHHPRGYRGWIIEMHKSGNVTWTHKGDVRQIKLDEEPTHSSKKNCYMFHIAAPTMEHAVKIANEKRAQMIANNQWLKEHIEWLEARYPKKQRQPVRKEIIAKEFDEKVDAVLSHIKPKL